MSPSRTASQRAAAASGIDVSRIVASDCRSNLKPMHDASRGSTASGSADGASWAPVDFGAEIWLGGVAQAEDIIAVTGTLPAADFSSTAGVWVKASD